MKTKLIATMLFSAICLSFVVGGISNLQPVAHAQPPSLNYTVYLPLVAVPPCTYKRPTAYIAVSKPIVRVGDLVTVTTAVANDCAIIGNPDYTMWTQPEGLLYPSSIVTDAHPLFIANGSYQEYTFTVQAVGTGVVTITAGLQYETQLPGFPPYMWFYDAALATTAIRMFP